MTRKNKQQKKNKVRVNKRRSKPRRRKNRGMNGGAMSMAPSIGRAVHQVCSNFDPFCQAAVGAKQFDSNTMPSLTYQNRMVLAIVTDASGQAALWFNNTPTGYYATGTIAGGNITAWTATDSNFLSSVTATNLSQWRVVSSGLRYFTTQAWSAASGFINVTEMSQTYFSGFTGFPATSLRLGPISKTLALRDAQITFVSRSKGMKAREYQESGSADSGYTGCLLYFSGTASTTIGHIEFVTNYEWTADPNSAFQLFASPAAEHKPVILDAVTHLSSVNSNIKAFTGGVESAASFMSEARGAVNKVAGLIEDIGAIGGMVSPGMKALGGGAHALKLLTN